MVYSVKAVVGGRSLHITAVRQVGAYVSRDGWGGVVTGSHCPTDILDGSGGVRGLYKDHAVDQKLTKAGWGLVAAMVILGVLTFSSRLLDVGFTRYRAAYRRAFPDASLGERVLSHAMNRRMAQVKGFGFVRITPTSRSANSSSSLSERWGVALHSDAYQMAANRRRGMCVQYADITDLMLMLDMKLGGGVMDSVNEGRSLIQPRE